MNGVQIMKRFFLFMGMLFFLAIFLPEGAVAGPSGSVQCDSYKMDLTGTAFVYGVSYTEHVVLEKVKKSGSAQGQWKLTAFETTSIFPGTLPVQIDRVDRQSLGYGMWMDVHSVAAGNVVRASIIASNIVLDVVGNRIGYIKTNVWCGTISGKQVSFKWHQQSPTEPVLTGPLTLQGEQIKVEIASPKIDERYVFSEAAPGTITFTATARATPASYSSQLVWSVEGVPGSTMTIEPANATGPSIKVTYTKLPPQNSGFGRKKLTVRLKVGDCQVGATSNVRLFFPAFAANNPGGAEPNWFYYWKQTSAGVGPVKYAGASVHCGSGSSHRALGYYRNTIFDTVYYICNLRNMGDDFPFMAKKDNNGIMGNVKVFGIDTFAIACRHEYGHYTHYQTWWKQYRTDDKFLDTNRNGILDDKEQLLDKDGDLVPDALEPGMGLNPNNRNTFGIGPDGNDEELLCWMAETNWPIGSANSQDWAKPGKQWK
jgi:hypothetical protein